MTKIQKTILNSKTSKKPEILRVLTLTLSKKRVRTIHLNSYRILETVLVLDFKVDENGK